MAGRPDGWKRGLPPGPYYEGMVDDFEVYWAPAGVKWHRRRSPDEKAQHLDALRRNREVCNRTN